MFSEIIHGLVWRTQIDGGVDPNCPEETLFPCSLRIGIIPAGQNLKLKKEGKKYVSRDSLVSEALQYILCSPVFVVYCTNVCLFQVQPTASALLPWAPTTP